MDKKKKYSIRTLLVIIFLLLFGIITAINLRGNYLEYKELGENFIPAFWTRLIYKYAVMGVNFILIYLIMYFTGRGIKKGLKVFFEQENKPMPKLPNKSIALVVTSIESIFVAQVFTPKILLCASNTSFGQTDPVFNLDVSFFMFIQPIIKLAINYFIGICIVMIVYSFLYYVIVFNKYFDGIDKETLKNNRLMKNIYRAVKFIAIGLALKTSISSMDIVYADFITTDNNIKLTGAGITEATVRLWGYNILAIVLLVAIWRSVNRFKNNKESQVLKNLAIVPIYMVAMFLVMVLFDYIFVHSNEFDKEKGYIESNISMTKKAFNMECDIKNIDYSGTVTVEEVEQNENIINNTVIVDKEDVLAKLAENQKGTGYYNYKTAKILNYNINGENALLYVSPREIVNNKRTYNSKTYEYTHGYGLIFTSATEFTENGEIKYIQNDISGENQVIKINTPQIYYGLETDTTVVTKANGKTEFDYEDNGKEYVTTYSANGGISLNFLDRLVLAFKQKNPKLALSTSVTSESKVLINRNILERASLALPDLLYDDNPYTVVDENGDIYWIIDSYTVSASYPYSTYAEIEYNGQKRDINYIRNSVKVIVNAYTGEMKFYITDRTDPIVMAYRNLYPNIFEDLDASIPTSISKKFVYPELLYKIQATMLEEYHIAKADVLYRSDDTWEKATYNQNQTNKKKGETLEAYYTTCKDANNEDVIGLIQMYTKKGKQNLVSYLIGTVQDRKK